MFRGDEDAVGDPHDPGTWLIQTRLFRYHEELKVRDARARGREEGRAEVRILLHLHRKLMVVPRHGKKPNAGWAALRQSLSIQSDRFPRPSYSRPQRCKGCRLRSNSNLNSSSTSTHLSRCLLHCEVHLRRCHSSSRARVTSNIPSKMAGNSSAPKIVSNISSSTASRRCRSNGFNRRFSRSWRDETSKHLNKKIRLRCVSTQSISHHASLNIPISRRDRKLHSQGSQQQWRTLKVCHLSCRKAWDLRPEGGSRIMGSSVGRSRIIRLAFPLNRPHAQRPWHTIRLAALRLLFIRLLLPNHLLDRLVPNLQQPSSRHASRLCLGQTPLTRISIALSMILSSGRCFQAHRARRSIRVSFPRRTADIIARPHLWTSHCQIRSRNKPVIATVRRLVGHRSHRTTIKGPVEVTA